MSVLKKLLVIIGLVLAVFVLVGFVLPKEYSVQRSVVISAEPSEVYPNIVDLRKWSKWGVWFKRDPDMVLSYSGPDRAIGMRSEWKSISEGNGEMEITQLEHNKRVVYRLYFPDFDMGSTGVVELQETDSGTRVTWRDEGAVGINPLDRYFVLMMDDMIGPDFELGLENLKTVTENKG